MLEVLFENDRGEARVDDKGGPDDGGEVRGHFEDGLEYAKGRGV